jgi:hypothetical protein
MKPRVAGRCIRAGGLTRGGSCGLIRFGCCVSAARMRGMGHAWRGLRAVEKRVISPISAIKVMAVIGPIHGRACSACTRGSGLVRVTRSRSSGATSRLMASIRVRQSVTTARCTADNASSASKTRPAEPHNGSATPTPRSARIACTRHLRAATRTSAARWRSRARWSRTAWGAILASGNNSARRRWAKVRALTLSSLSLAEAIALQRLGWTKCGSSSSKPALAVGDLESDRRARLQAPQHRGQLGGAVARLR